MAEVVQHATQFPRYPTMIETSSHRDRSPYESSYRSSSSSSSRRTTSQSRHATATTPTSSRPTTSSASEQSTPASSRAIPRRESVTQPQPLARESNPQVEPPSPRLTPSESTSLPAGYQIAPESLPETDSSTAQPSVSRQSSNLSTPDSGVRIKIRDLRHIESITRDGSSALGRRPSDQSDADDQDPQPAPQYEISGMPITDVIEMVAGLLTKITATNDQQHEHIHRGVPTPDGAHGMSPQTSSVLAFHGKNVPSITILSYLGRIHKYCPTTYEVFISLLVYFDRMTEKVNAGLMQGLRDAQERSRTGRKATRGHDTPEYSHDGTAGPDYGTPPSSLPDDLDPRRQRRGQRGDDRQFNPSREAPLSPPLSDSDPQSLSQFFVVDSYNIHRLVIAAVTCASKYFSDIFYTNSRYAKVGGLPLVELNHLEMQFLLLNDFRLAVPVEELEAYATMLVEFYAREVAGQRNGDDDGHNDETMKDAEVEAEA